MPLIPVLRRERPVKFREFKASLVTISKEFQADQGGIVRPCLKKKEEKKMQIMIFKF